jgi:hypothetical protein
MMENTRIRLWLGVLAVALPLLGIGAPAVAQEQSFFATERNFNPPPCDYSDTFYRDNGVDPTQIVGRFGDDRRTGPPARGARVNWVADGNCSLKDPQRRNVRILATTGGFTDDGTGAPNDFISILGFLTSVKAFEPNYTRQVGEQTISLKQLANPRGIATVRVIANFEAYAALKQRLPDGTFAANPCSSHMASPLAPATPCFAVNTIESVFTPNLRQDWRFDTNHNAIDGSDGNCINTDPAVCAGGVNNSPFGYFCDDLLGIWLVDYFWFTADPANPGAICGPIYRSLIRKNGASLDGTPIIKTADELQNLIEANGCGAEGKLAVDGSDGGAVGFICPAIPDPRNGAIAADAFLDQVRLPDGSPQSPQLELNFLSLQRFGVFPFERGERDEGDNGNAGDDGDKDDR